MGKRVHLIGIGGAGMSALARFLIQQGDVISGSDLRETDQTLSLAKLGARIFAGQAGTNLEKVNRLRGEDRPSIESGPRWWYLTMALYRLGETEKARTYYDQLVKQMDSIATEGNKLLRAEAAELLGIEQRRDPEN